jgi:hypothetical protein
MFESTWARSSVCPKGSALQNGVCVPTPTCTGDTVYSNGVCIGRNTVDCQTNPELCSKAISCPLSSKIVCPNTQMCSENLILYNNNCVPNTIAQCPTNTQLQAGHCINVQGPCTAPCNNVVSCGNPVPCPSVPGQVTPPPPIVIIPTQPPIIYPNPQPPVIIGPNPQPSEVILVSQPKNMTNVINITNIANNMNVENVVTSINNSNINTINLSSLSSSGIRESSGNSNTTTVEIVTERITEECCIITEPRRCRKVNETSDAVICFSRKKHVCGQECYEDPQMDLMPMPIFPPSPPQQPSQPLPQQPMQPFPPMFSYIPIPMPMPSACGWPHGCGERQSGNTLDF